MALYESFETGENGAATMFGATWYTAQTFTPLTSHTIEEVQLYLATSANPGTVTVSIKATDGPGKPTGSNLATDTIAGSGVSISPTYTWKSFTFGTPISLLSGTKYAIVLRAAFDQGGAIFYWRWNSSGGYSRGQYLLSTNSGSSWVGYGNDCYFREYGASGPPSKATNPSPADNATDEDFSGLQLSWDDGGGADTYEVYIGVSGSLTLVSSTQAGTTYTTTLAELETIFGTDEETGKIEQKIYWRIDSTNDGGTTTGDEWNFDPRPTKASNASPAHEMTDMTLDWQVFSWDEVTNADTYDVYMGTELGPTPASNMELILDADPDFSMAQAYMATVTTLVYPNTGQAAYDYDYYWRVDTKNIFGTTTGDDWEFTTIDFDRIDISYVPISGSGPYDTPPGVEGTDWRYTGENNLVTIRKLVAAANNKFWYEEL